MRKVLLHEGSGQLDYEIRSIVKKAEALEGLGKTIYWENIGDPVLKHAQVPGWVKQILTELVNQNATYGYCHSKGVLETRAFLAQQNNQKGGVQLTAEDVLFFNGLGDAIAKLYQFLSPHVRVIGPSPAYSTHSALEAAHSNKEPVTYCLDPENHWYPDLEDLYLKVKYNPNIVGILIINPDNPTGMIYPPDYLARMVAIAREFNLFVVSDEIYTNIIYRQAQTRSLSEVLGKVPGIALKGISKDCPWPGARCGWMEFYNRSVDADFNQYCATLENAKMIEVCSTTLPQKALPLIQQHPAYASYLTERREAIAERGEVIAQYLKDIPYITFNPTHGAFYNTIVFKEGVLSAQQSLSIPDPKVKRLVEGWTQDVAADKRFVYYLLAAKGVCVVPLSSFQSRLSGFRITLLEEDKEALHHTFSAIADAIGEFCTSDKKEEMFA